MAVALALPSKTGPFMVDVRPLGVGGHRRACSTMECEIVLAIMEYLQTKYPGWCFVRVEPVTAMRMALKVKGVMHGGAWKDGAWADGVADILGIGQWHGIDGGHPAAPIAFEVKSRTGRQRLSQMEFERRWKRSGGRYYIVRSVEDVMEAME